MPFRPEKQGNPYYPLPRDYAELSQEGQRLARLNAVMLQETPEDLTNAWAFFRRWYLEPADTGWYKMWQPSPPMHYQMLHDLGQYSRNVWAAPRGFSKSTVMREATLLLTLTRPHFAVSLIQATIKKYRKSLDKLLDQFQTNKFLNDDFNPYFGERLKPKRGHRPWSSELMRLPNGSTIEGGSPQGALRGDRPNLLLIDDPEYDDEEKQDRVMLFEEFEGLLFKQLLPMLLRGCGMFWIGTIISRQCFLYAMAKGEDPRFQNFNRRVLAIESSNGAPLWPERWDEQAITDLRTALGESAFQSEYMNNPGSSASRILKLHPDWSSYTVDGHPEKTPNPFDSDCLIHYKKKVVQPDKIVVVPVEHQFGPWAAGLYRIMTVDFIRKPSPTSDYACIGVYGFDEDDTLWVLDQYLDRVCGSPFVRKIFEMALQWQVRIVGTEAVSIQEEVSQETAEMIAEMAAGTGFAPRVFPIRYARRHLKNTDTPTQISKPERIAAMEARFARHKIRLPMHRRNEFAIAQLIHQIEYFTLDLGLLRFDDAVDTLAMHQYVPRRRGSGVRLKKPEGQFINDLLSAGNFVDSKTGLQYGLAVDLSHVSDNVMDAAYKRRFDTRRKLPPSLRSLACPGLMQFSAR